ncbi:hypothetical protein [Halorientalis halophila]|uniref:hypothetical protein n=1 Tax=Halorientalis halophila TaxID=3108499 RepID=UPI00300B0B1A
MTEPERRGLAGVVDGALTLATAPTVEVVANLLVDLDDARLHLPSVAGPVHIRIDRLREAVRIVRTEEETLKRLDATLTAGGYTAEVYVGETQVALLGAEADPGRVSRRLADGRTELFAGGVLRAAVRDP